MMFALLTKISRGIGVLFLFTNCGLLFLHPKTGSSQDLSKYSLLFGIQRPVTSNVEVNEIDTTPPAILTASPTLSSINIPISQKIMITFTEVVVPINSPVTIMDSTSNPVNGTIRWDKDLLEFTPTTNLSYNMKYTVTLSLGIKDTSGNEFPAGFTYDFTTVVSPNTAPLSVISTTPVNSTLNYNVGSTLHIAFNKEINPATFTTSNVTVTSLSGNSSISVYANSANGTISPLPTWDYATTYTVTLKQSIQQQFPLPSKYQ